MQFNSSSTHSARVSFQAEIFSGCASVRSEVLIIIFPFCRIRASVPSAVAHHPPQCHGAVRIDCSLSEKGNDVDDGIMIIIIIV